MCSRRRYERIFVFRRRDQVVVFIFNFYSRSQIIPHWRMNKFCVTRTYRRSICLCSACDVCINRLKTRFTSDSFGVLQLIVFLVVLFIWLNNFFFFLIIFNFYSKHERIFVKKYRVVFFFFLYGAQYSITKLFD